MQRRSFGFIYIGLLFFSFFVFPAYSNGPARENAGKTEDTARTVEDTRIYLSRLEKIGFAGVILVGRGQDVLLAEGFGLADRERSLAWTPDTVSTIGSITKQFTAAAVLKLEEGGRLKVSDSLRLYFEDVPEDKKGITLHHLLTHSSGLSDPEEIGDWSPVPVDEYVRRVFARPLLFQPGNGYAYANANFSLLGAIIEKLSGMSYEAFLRERLLLPSEIKETGYLLPKWGKERLARGYLAGKLWGTVLDRPMASDGPYWGLRANGGLHSTAHDMFRWARALLAGRVLSAGSMEKYWAPHVSEGGDTYYGYGWSIAEGPGGTKIVTHNGGNGIFFADMAIVPEADLVIFLMTNVIAENRAANVLLEQIGRRFIAGQAYPQIPEVVDLDETVLKSLAGIYRLPGKGGAFRLTMDGPVLYIEAEGHIAFDLLNSVEDSEPGRLEKLNGLMERIISANRNGDFSLMFEAYGGRIPVERLKVRWAELTEDIEANRGRILNHDVLGSARTAGREETVVRFHGERGIAYRTYVWAPGEEGRLRGMSIRGLTVRLRLYPSSQRDFFTWDGGIRPPKTVKFEPGRDGGMRLIISGKTEQAAVRVGG